MWAAPCAASQHATRAFPSPLRSILRLTYWRGSQSWRRGPLSRKPRVQSQRNFLHRHGERGEPMISSFIPRHKITAFALIYHLSAAAARGKESACASSRQAVCACGGCQMCKSAHLLLTWWAQRESGDQAKQERRRKANMDQQAGILAV